MEPVAGTGAGQDWIGSTTLCWYIVESGSAQYDTIYVVQQLCKYVQRVQIPFKILKHLGGSYLLNLNVKHLKVKLHR